MFASLSDRLTATLKTLRTKGRLSEQDIAATVREIRLALLDADVALPVVREFTETVREQAVGAAASGALNPAQQVVKIVHDELVTILGGETRRLAFAKTPPTVIMLAGLQGSGKTTLAGKLARWLRSEGHTPLLVAADLQRPNAVNQLQIVGQRAGATVFAPEAGNVSGSEDGVRSFGDPVAVARDGLAKARADQYDVVIVDTAGRLGVDAELMQQAADIRAAVSPDEVLFVVDAMIGQDAVTTAQAFMEGVGFTGVVLTKLDGDARGGAALSVRNVTGQPIMFASTGEKLEDFEIFHPDRMASRILDMGDVLTLIEQAERAFDREQAEQMARKLVAEEDFTFDDFLAQMAAVKQMGSLKKMLGMMPGMAGLREQLDNLDEREFDRAEAMVRSMTPQERAHPKLLNGSRRARIARGAGRTVADVNDLVERLAGAQKMMKQLRRGGGMPGLPGMGGLGGAPGLSGPGRKAKGKGKKRTSGRSGNPAKRAEQERAAAERNDQRTEQSIDRALGSAFGPGATQAAGAGSKGDGGARDEVDPSNVSLPPGFDKFLGR